MSFFPYRKNYQSKNRLHGLTLIEVLASVALLSALMVSVLAVRASHVRQVNLAAKKILAAKLLDRHLARWYEDDISIPINQQGDLDATRNFLWQTNSMPSQNSWDAIKVRVDVIDSVSGQVLCAVEVLSPDSTEPIQ